jgi:hypothetical protein
VKLDASGHVEPEHGTTSGLGHDHRLCVLVYEAQWWPGSAAPDLSAPRPRQAGQAPAESVHGDARPRREVARSPPHPARAG